jgi:hypothetical protein
MWNEGYLKDNGEAISWQVKSYDEGSEFGIDEGRISKLFIFSKTTGAVLASYDRGWDKKPATKTAKAVYVDLLKKFN